MVLVPPEPVLSARLTRAVSQATRRVRAPAAVTRVVIGTIKSTNALRRLARSPPAGVIPVTGVRLAALKPACAVAVVVRP